MKPLILIIILFCTLSPLSAQKLSYSPEVVFGNRSVSYQHLINFSFSEKWSINNLTLFDSEYEKDENNIFFIRNSLGYKLSDLVLLNGGVGIKKPGAFITGNIQFSLRNEELSLNYSVGSTYQDRFTLEQSVFFKYMPRIRGKFKPFLKLFMVMNTDFKIIDRSLQQIRLGVSKKLLNFGFATNLDQFNNSSKTLKNIGVFLKYNF